MRTAGGEELKKVGGATIKCFITQSSKVVQFLSFALCLLIPFFSPPSTYNPSKAKQHNESIHNNVVLFIKKQTKNKKQIEYKTKK